MMLPSLLGGVCTVVATLAVNSAVNMLQTYNTLSSFSSSSASDAPPSLQTVNAHPLNEYLTSNGRQAIVDPSKSVEDIVDDMKLMSRRDLLELWLRCESPPPIDIQGDWNGALLDNNGPVMTTVSTILTDLCFGRGRKWAGKSFRSSEGINRFSPRRRKNRQQLEHQHQFDLSVERSRLDPKGESLTLRYSNYQRRLSLWRSMRDEVRVLRLDGEGRGVLIGLGCMKWSGALWRDGMMNSSPFCLFR